MSTTVQINVKQLLEEINKILCEDCKKRLESLELPIAQTVKVKDLMK